MDETVVESAPSPDSATSAAPAAPAAAPESSGATNTGQPAHVRKPPETPVDKAYARAMARKASKDTPAPEQAAATGDASTPAGDGPTAPADGAISAVETVAPAATDGQPASTAIAAPEQWPQELREKFEALPPAGREIALAIQKDLQAGFTQGMQALNAQKKELADLAALRDEFGSNPRAALEKIAAQAGIPVYFEPPAAAEEPPEFTSVAEMLKWTKEQTLKAVRAEQANSRAEQEAQVLRAKAELEFRQELDAASKAYPDLQDHGPAILQTLQAMPALSVEKAYQLVTYPGLREAAQKHLNEKTALQAELQKAQAELKAMKANAGRPAQSQAMKETPQDGRPKDIYEGAFERAARKLAQRRATSH